MFCTNWRWCRWNFFSLVVTVAVFKDQNTAEIFGKRFDLLALFHPQRHDRSVHPNLRFLEIRETINITRYPKNWVVLVFVKKYQKKRLNNSIYSTTESQNHLKSLTTTDHISIFNIFLASKPENSTIVHINEKMGLVPVTNEIFVNFSFSQKTTKCVQVCWNRDLDLQLLCGTE